MNGSGKRITAATFLFCSLMARAQLTYTGPDYADAFLATGSPGNPVGPDLTGLNFGAAGTLAVAPASSPNGEFESILKFNFTNALGLFNTTYGTNGWSITGMSLQLTSNDGTAGEQPDNALFNVISGGQFVIEWLATNGWVEGTGKPKQPTTDGVTYDSLPALLAGPHEILGTNTYTPPGDNVPVTYPLPLNTNLLNEIANGADATLLVYAADNQIGYLFNSWNFGNGNQPMIHVTANAFLKILSGHFTNGVFHLTGAGGANFPYQVQAATSLTTTNWQTLGTVMADGTGRVQFGDTTVSNQPQRFYRLSR